ncbi:hypothetical protein [Vreelandella sp. EE22]
MNATAPVVTLAEPCTLLDTGNVSMTTQTLLMDGLALRDGEGLSAVVLHRNVTPAGCLLAFITVPAEHLLTLDLNDSTIARFVHQQDQRYSILFTHERYALAYLIKHYGLTSANDRDPTPPASPGPAPVNVAPLPTPSRQPRRLLSTPAYRPHGVINMSKKQPIRVFLAPETHSRHLIQAGTHGLTSSALSERLIEYGLSQLESGHLEPLDALSHASPAPNSNEA